MRPHLPAFAFALGIAGLIPFVGCAIGTIASSDALQAARFLTALIGYGAVILAFLGGVQWGFVLSEPDASGTEAARRLRPRLILAVLPSLLGWLALLIQLVGIFDLALCVLLAGFIGFVLAEIRLHRRGLMPAGYITLRIGLTTVVTLLLGTVLVLRLLGARIIF